MKKIDSLGDACADAQANFDASPCRAAKVERCEDCDKFAHACQRVRAGARLYRARQRLAQALQAWARAETIRAPIAPGLSVRPDVPAAVEARIRELRCSLWWYSPQGHGQFPDAVAMVSNR